MSLEFLLYHVTFLSIGLLLSQSLNLAWRVDRFSLGHHGFFGIGAYTTAFLLTLVKGRLNLILPSAGEGSVLLLVCFLTALTAGLLISWGLHLLFRRLADDYFAVATLVFAEIARNVFSNWESVGGALGFEAPYLVFSNSRDDRLSYVLLYASIGLAMNVCLFVLVRRLQRSTYWLWIDATRHDQLAAEMSGIEASQVQEAVFVLSAGCAAIAGALFVNFTTFVVPDDFTFVAGLPIILYVVLGRFDPLKCVLATVLMTPPMKSSNCVSSACWGKRSARSCPIGRMGRLRRCSSLLLSHQP